MNSITEIFENSKHLLDSVDSFVNKYVGCSLLRKCVSAKQLLKDKIMLCFTNTSAYMIFKTGTFNGNYKKDTFYRFDLIKGANWGRLQLETANKVILDFESRIKMETAFRQNWYTPETIAIVKIGFVSYVQILILMKRQLSTRMESAGKQIELYFRMVKSHLRLRTGCHSTSYDAITAHMIIVALRYMILSVERFNNIDNRFTEELFYGIQREVIND